MKNDPLSLPDSQLHDAAYLDANYTRGELIEAANGFIPERGRALHRLSRHGLAVAIARQAREVKRWADAQRATFPKSRFA